MDSWLFVSISLLIITLVAFQTEGKSSRILYRYFITREEIKCICRESTRRARRKDENSHRVSAEGHKK